MLFSSKNLAESTPFRSAWIRRIQRKSFRSVVNIAPAFGGINLEDISAPRCFEIETRLKELLDIPVFHDDQHGTAIVVLAGIINALKVTGKEKEDCRVVVNGAGSCRCCHYKTAADLWIPAYYDVRYQRNHLQRIRPDLNWMQKEMAKVTNLERQTGTACRCSERC